MKSQIAIAVLCAALSADAQTPPPPAATPTPGENKEATPPSPERERQRPRPDNPEAKRERPADPNRRDGERNRGTPDAGRRPEGRGPGGPEGRGPGGPEGRGPGGPEGRGPGGPEGRGPGGPEGHRPGGPEGRGPGGPEGRGPGGPEGRGPGGPDGHRPGGPEGRGPGGPEGRGPGGPEGRGPGGPEGHRPGGPEGHGFGMKHGPMPGGPKGPMPGMQHGQNPSGPMGPKPGPQHGTMHGGPKGMMPGMLHGPGHSPGAPMKKVSMGMQPYLGVVTSPLSPALSAQLGLTEGFGLMVENVLPDSPALAAGIQKFDVLKLLGDQELTQPSQLSALLRKAGKGNEVSVTVLRRAQEQKVAVKVGEKEQFKHEPEHRVAFPNLGGPDRERMVAGLREKMEGHRAKIQEWSEAMRKWAKEPKGDAPAMPDFTPPMMGHPHGDAHPGVKPHGPRPEHGDRKDAKPKRPMHRGRAVLKDTSGQVEIQSDDTGSVILIKDTEGTEIYKGAYTGESDIEAIPAVWRDKVRSMEQAWRSAQNENELDAETSDTESAETPEFNAPQPEAGQPVESPAEPVGTEAFPAFN